MSGAESDEEPSARFRGNAAGRGLSFFRHTLPWVAGAVMVTSSEPE